MSAYKNLVKEFVEDKSLLKSSTNRKDIGVGTISSNYRRIKPILDFYEIKVVQRLSKDKIGAVIYFTDYAARCFYSTRFDGTSITFGSFVSYFMPVHEAAHRAYAFRYDPDSIKNPLYNNPSQEVEREVHVLTCMFLKRLGYPIRRAYHYFLGSSDRNEIYLLQEKLLSIPFASRFLNEELRFI